MLTNAQTDQHRLGAFNGNADMLSRLPLLATDEDKTDYSSTTSPDDVGVCFMKTFGKSSSHAVDLSGLVPGDPDGALGGLPPIAEDFCDFRKHGDRMRVDDLVAPPGVFVPRAFPSVDTEGPLRHLACEAHDAPPEHSDVFDFATGFFYRSTLRAFPSSKTVQLNPIQQSRSQHRP